MSRIRCQCLFQRVAVVWLGEHSLSLHPAGDDRSQRLLSGRPLWTAVPHTHQVTLVPPSHMKSICQVPWRKWRQLLSSGAGHPKRCQPGGKTTLKPAFNLVQVGYDDTNLDVYIPFFLLLQFIFYFGWLKVFLWKLYMDEGVSIY